MTVAWVAVCRMRPGRNLRSRGRTRQGATHQKRPTGWFFAEPAAKASRKPFRGVELLLVLCPKGFGQCAILATKLVLLTLRAGKMTKPHHKLKKANHGARPANAKARKAKRKKVRT